MKNDCIYIASDHAGRELLDKVEEYLLSKKYNVVKLPSLSENDDYPDVAKSLATKVVENDARGIAICGTGIGITIACNKVKGIRASVCYDKYTTEMARRHNNLNILGIGSRVNISFEQYKEIIDIYLNTPFEEGRHRIRIDKIDKI